MIDADSYADLDGLLCPARELAAAVDEDVFFRGHGLFETLLAESGVLAFAEQHFDRMRNSARQLDLPPPPIDAILVARIRAVLEANVFGHSTARVRLRLDRNELLVLASAADNDLARQRESGVVATVLGSGYVRATRPEHKTVDRAALRFATGIARERGVAEALLVDDDGRLLEGATSNVFCVQNGELYTPPTGAGILPGVTRSVVLSIAAEAGLRVHQTAPDLEQLVGAEEVFLTSAIRLLLPVIGVDELTIGSGKPGPVSRMIAAALFQRISAPDG